MTRRSFLAASAAGLSAKELRRNVLLLSVDDMNDWVGCLGGYPGVKTPNMDALAARGVLFSNAHCAAPLCNPSRTAVLTGLRPSTSGIYGNEQFWRPAMPQVVTLPEYFKKNGYHVAGAGKVFHHTAGMNPPDQWHEFQLQVFDDPWYRRPEWYPWNRKVPAPAGHPFNGLKDFPGEFDWGVLAKPAAEYGDQRAVDFGIEVLNRSHDRPFFLAIGLWHPHIPLFAPQNYFDLYPENRVRLPESPEDDLADVPPVGREFAAFRRAEHDRILREGKWHEVVRAYLACISFADDMAGRLLGALERSAYARDTIVVLWSDNGWHLGEKNHWHKSTLWQRSTHVPLIVSAPGMRQPGKERRQPVSLLDIYPTLVELCGLPAKGDLEGESLAPLLRNPSAGRKPAVITYLPGNHAVRGERWRYIRYRDGGEELYDSLNDPNEYRNLASEPRYSGLKRDLGRWIPASNAPPAPNRDAYDFDYERHVWKLKEKPG